MPDRLNKIFQRMLGKTDGETIAARNALLAMLAGADKTAHDLVLLDEPFASRVIRKLEDEANSLHEQLMAAREDIKTLKAAPPKPPHQPSKPPKQPPKPPLARQRGRRRHLVLRDGCYAFRYRYPKGGSVERKLFTNDEAVAEAMATELLAKLKAGEPV